MTKQLTIALTLCLAGLGLAPAAKAQNCQITTGQVQNRLMSTLETGFFIAQFDVTPANHPGIVGLSRFAVQDLTGMAVIVAFTSNGTIVARDYNFYGASNTVVYSPGVTYHFWVFVDVQGHKYSVFVSPPGGPGGWVAKGFRFRQEQSAIPMLVYWNMYAFGASTETVCNFSLLQ